MKVIILDKLDKTSIIRVVRTLWILCQDTWSGRLVRILSKDN